MLCLFSAVDRRTSCYSEHFYLRLLSFLAELFCPLTGNILGLKSRGGRRADDLWMTCR